MSRYQRYPAYRDSGVEWIGEIPEHWEVKRLKYIATCNDESLNENTDPQYEIKYIDISSVNLSQGITHKEILPFEKAPSRARRIVRHGDTIVSTVRTYLKAIAPIIEPDENLIVSTGFAVIRSMKFYSYRFLGFFLQTEGFVGQVVANSVGVSYPAINANELLQFSVIVPPFEEQQAIASFLDRKTAEIDELITKKEDLLKKLDEKRTALITRAVTKGIDPSVPMKESGVEWLGEIPTHWEVKRLKQTMLLITNKSGAETQNVALENIESWSGRYIPSDTEFEGDGVTFQVGDILFGKLRPYLAKAYLAEFPGSAVGDFHVMRPITTIFHGRYTLYLILNHGVISIIDGSTFGAKMPRVSWDFMGNIQLPLPPLEEQQAIAEHIEKKTATIDRQKVQVAEAIERLNEYRSALITDAVTGKMDVHSHRTKESLSA
jgi:restriction endonuclease S subunit